MTVCGTYILRKEALETNLTFKVKTHYSWKQVYALLSSYNPMRILLCG